MIYSVISGLIESKPPVSEVGEAERQGEGLAVPQAG